MLSQLSVYEPAPSGAVTRWLERKCGRFICSHFFDDQALGQTVQGYRNESLEHLSFDDRSFDIVITQDVFEHIENPRSAFKEVERVLKPGGSHVFTIPYYPGQLTEARVRIVNGAPVSAHELEYHGNPIDNAGSLVFTRFGSDLKDIVFRESGMRTSIHPLHEPGAGIEGESVIIFHSRKE
jgi:SAM-dependent methyltransferase